MADLWYLNKTILIIDDEPFMRSLVVDLLLDIGFRTIMEAGDGEKGLELLQSGKAVDLIILDLEMPVLGGIDTLTQIRFALDPTIANIPVIVVTGNSELSNVSETVKLRIHDYVVKPISRNNLVLAVKNGFEGDAIDPKKFNEKLASQGFEE